MHIGEVRALCWPKIIDIKFNYIVPLFAPFESTRFKIYRTNAVEWARPETCLEVRSFPVTCYPGLRWLGLNIVTKWGKRCSSSCAKFGGDTWRHSYKAWENLNGSTWPPPERGLRTLREEEFFERPYIWSTVQNANTWSSSHAMSGQLIMSWSFLFCQHARDRCREGNANFGDAAGVICGDIWKQK